MKKLAIAVLASAFLAGTAFAAPATHENASQEFGGYCATGLAMGKMVKTDCHISWTDSATHKTYCFSSEEMKKEWAKDTTKHIKQASDFYAKNQTTGAGSTTGTTHN